MTLWPIKCHKGQIHGLWGPAFEGCSEPQWPGRATIFFVGNTWILLQWSEGNHKETWDKYGRNMERRGFDSMDFRIQLTFESMVPFLKQTLQISSGRNLRSSMQRSLCSWPLGFFAWCTSSTTTQPHLKASKAESFVGRDRLFPMLSKTNDQKKAFAIPFLQNSFVRKQCRKPWKSYVKDFLLPKVWCHQGLDWVRTCVRVKPPWPKDLLPTSGTSTQNLRFKRIELFTLDSQFKY